MCLGASHRFVTCIDIRRTVLADDADTGLVLGGEARVGVALVANPVVVVVGLTPVTDVGAVVLIAWCVISVIGDIDLGGGDGGLPV